MSDHNPELRIGQKTLEAISQAHQAVICPVADQLAAGIPHGVLKSISFALDTGAIVATGAGVYEVLAGRESNSLYLGAASMILLAGGGMFSKLDDLRWIYERPEKI